MKFRFLCATFFAVGIIASPASACFAEIDSAKMFDKPPALLAQRAKVAKFEVIGSGTLSLRIRLHADLFDRKKGEIIRVLAPWNSCIIRSERFGAEYGAVSVVRNGDGQWRFYLHTYDFEDRGWWPFSKRIAVGRPFASRPFELGTEVILGEG